MLGDQDTSDSLICAVHEGRLERVRELISSLDLSYSQAWSEGYVLLQDALENGHTEVAKLLLTSGSTVNSRNKEPAVTPLHWSGANACFHDGDVEFISRNKDPSVTPLHWSVVNACFPGGDVEFIKMLLDRGADINAKTEYGETPLHMALRAHDRKIIELLVNQGADVNARDKHNRTPLQLALNSCGGKFFKLLLTRDADVNGQPYIHMAVNIGDSEKVKLLLEYGANVNAEYVGKTVLHFAVEGCENIVKLLLEHGANVHAEYVGKTVLHFAVEKGCKLNIVKLLLEYGANVHVPGKGSKTLLHFAVKEGRGELVQLLLEYGANVDVPNMDGKTVLHYAVEEGCPVVVEHVLKGCPDVNNKSNRSALNVAVHGYLEESDEIVENLLQYGFTVNPEDVNNCDLLHAAVMKGYLKIVEELLKYGTDVNKLYKPTNKLYKSISGKRYMLLHVAAKNRQEEVAKLLISYGADVNAQDEFGRTPMFYATQNAGLKITELLVSNKVNVKDDPNLLNNAVKSECREIVEFLLQHDVDVNGSDECGRTALHFTALGEDGGFILNKYPDINVKVDIAKLLLSRGANVNAAQTRSGITALHAATQQGYVKVVEALLEHNADVNCTVKTQFRNSTQMCYPEIRRRLLKFLPTNGSVNIYGSTPLHIAAESGHLEIVKLLLKFGAIIDYKNEYGRTALHIASRAGLEQIVVALLEHGSDINIMSKSYETALDFAMAGISSFYNEVDRYDSDDDCDHYSDDDYHHRGSATVSSYYNKVDSSFDNEVNTYDSKNFDHSLFCHDFNDCYHNYHRSAISKNCETPFDYVF